MSTTPQDDTAPKAEEGRSERHGDTAQPDKAESPAGTPGVSGESPQILVISGRRVMVIDSGNRFPNSEELQQLILDSAPRQQTEYVIQPAPRAEDYIIPVHEFLKPKPQFTIKDAIRPSKFKPQIGHKHNSKGPVNNRYRGMR